MRLQHLGFPRPLLLDEERSSTCHELLGDPSPIRRPSSGPQVLLLSLCSPSLDPYGYLQAADQLSVQVYSDLLVSSNLYPTFIYHTGLCMSIQGAENFATSLPTPDKEGRACYSKTATMLTKGQVWPLNITLFELYRPELHHHRRDASPQSSLLPSADHSGDEDQSRGGGPDLLQGLHPHLGNPSL